MGKIVSSIWQTIDGVIDASSMDKWFTPFDSKTRGKYINDTVHNCEVMIYGRLTYEMLSGYWSLQRSNEFGIADKLNTTKKYLVSRTIKNADWGETTILDKNIIGQIEKLKNNTKGNILIQGSASIVNLLIKHELLDNLNLLIHPYIAGSGKRLFEDEVKQQLDLIEYSRIDNSVCILKYKLRY